MVRARKKRSARSQPDPVVDLAKNLLAVWDADDASQHEYSELGERVSETVQNETSQQFSDWREAIETTISFTRAKSLEGALVQMVLALDTLDDVLPRLSEYNTDSCAKGLKIERLLRSAVRAVRTATRTEGEPAAQSVASIYSGDYDAGLWFDRAKDWSEQGRLFRLKDERC